MYLDCMPLFFRNNFLLLVKKPQNEKRCNTYKKIQLITAYKYIVNFVTDFDSFIVYFSVILCICFHLKGFLWYVYDLQDCKLLCVHVFGLRWKFLLYYISNMFFFSICNKYIFYINKHKYEYLQICEVDQWSMFSQISCLILSIMSLLILVPCISLLATPKYFMQIWKNRKITHC